MYASTVPKRDKKKKAPPTEYSARGAVRRLGGLIPANFINHSLITGLLPVPILCGSYACSACAVSALNWPIAVCAMVAAVAAAVEAAIAVVSVALSIAGRAIVAGASSFCLRTSASILVVRYSTISP